MQVCMGQICNLAIGLVLVGLFAGPTSSCLVDLLRARKGGDESNPLPDGYLEKHYMNIPDKSGKFNEPLHQQVREALSKLPFKALSDPQATLPTPLEVLATIRETKREERNSAYRAIYEQLANLADEELNDCSTYMVEVIKSVWAQQRAKKVPARLAELLRNYLKHFGASAMEFCVDQIKMDELDKDNEAEIALSELFSVAKSVEVDDESLFKVLAKLNLYKDSLNVSQMGEVAKKWVGKDLPPTRQQPLSLIREMFNGKCGSFLDRSGTTVDLINLARLFGSERKYYKSKVRLLKLNEINRLCLSWLKDPSYRITDRLHTQLDGIFPILRPAPSDGEE